MNDYTNELNRCWLRIGAISKARMFTGEEVEYKYPLVNNEDAKNLQQAYEKFNSSFDDLLKAEMEYLESLKEDTDSKSNITNISVNVDKRLEIDEIVEKLREAVEMRIGE